MLSVWVGIKVCEENSSYHASFTYKIKNTGQNEKYWNYRVSYNKREQYDLDHQVYEVSVIHNQNQEAMYCT
jgi:hypothetical protein